jgi:hypothetical protein
VIQGVIVMIIQARGNQASNIAFKGHSTKNELSPKEKAEQEIVAYLDKYMKINDGSASGGDKFELQTPVLEKEKSHAAPEKKAPVIHGEPPASKPANETPDRVLAAKFKDYVGSPLKYGFTADDLIAEEKREAAEVSRKKATKQTDVSDWSSGHNGIE